MKNVVAVLVLFLLVAVGCDDGSYGIVDPADAQSKVTVGMSEQQVEDAIGGPKVTVEVLGSSPKQTQMIYESSTDGSDVTVLLENGAVTVVSIE